MSIDVSAIQSFTDAEMLKLTRFAIATITSGGGQEYAINGRTFTRADLGQLQAMEAYYSGRVDDAAASSNGGFSLARFGSPR